MGKGPRKKDNDMRASQGKMVAAPSGSPSQKQRSGAGASGMATQQYKQSGKKYDGPHYQKKDPKIAPFGGK